MAIAGIRTSLEVPAGSMDHWVEHLEDDAIGCRCERVTAQALRSLIRQGYCDVNEIKAMSAPGFMLGLGMGELICRMVRGTLDAGDAEILERMSPYRAFAGQEKLK